MLKLFPQNVSISFGQTEENQWQRLIEEIVKGNVIPVIGEDMLVDSIVDSEGNDTGNLHQRIVSFLASQIEGIENSPKTFSQLVYDRAYLNAVHYKKDQIYRLLYQIVCQMDAAGINHNPSNLLMELLNTKKFPFVITTSFTPVVEEAMNKVWGEGNVKVLQFSNDPQKNMQPSVGDIREASELNTPTVYYMFGKCSERQFSYVVTDVDMMNFCRSWMSEHGVPRRLFEELKNKYLLVLGNNYSDWLFRFVWYSLRSSADIMKDDIIVKDKHDEPLSQFLSRLETFVQNDPAAVVHRIREELEKKNSEDTVPKYKYDVFISYSRRDKEVAENLYNMLSKKGIKVWFDKTDIEKGHDWQASIIEGVNNSSLFVPILSYNIEKEAYETHEYRMEWKTASEISQKMGARTFIVPFTQEGFDFYNNTTKLPTEFLNKNAVWYKSNSDVEEISNVVVKELEILKQHGK